VIVETSELKTGTFFFGGLVGFVTGLVVAGVLAIWIYQSTPFRPETTPHAKLEPIKPKLDPKNEPKSTGQTGELAKDEKKPESERIVPPGTRSEASIAAEKAALAAEKAATDSAAAAKANASKSAVTEPSPSAEARGRLWLQVGAYANKQEAESQRARFAVLGYEAQIQSADVPEKGTVHRVRVGPYRDPDEAGKVRGDLARQGIEVTVVKPQ
jgi:cell division protein FtsN